MSAEIMPSTEPVPSEKSNPLSHDLPIYRHNGRSIGVLFEDISVFGAPAGASRVTDLPVILSGIVRAPLQMIRKFAGNDSTEATKVIRDVSGVVTPGETLLVLGRPGAGCSTTLKILGNSTGSFLKVDGTVKYSTISASEMAKSYGSEVVYNSEDDIHFPRLSVGQTLGFSLALRKPPAQQASDAEFSSQMSDKILGALGISHTNGTIVGNSFIRGVSGGERKRVSLAEMLSTNPAVATWDNPIRGLDSSSALSFLKLLKTMSCETGMANAVTLYQASEAMYRECFDRVLVLYDGRMIYNGPTNRAKQYFIELGFECHERQSTPDFLTTVTSSEERVVRQDHIGPTPLDPDDFAAAFRRSVDFQNLQCEMEAYRLSSASDPLVVTAFKHEARRVKSKLSTARSLEPRSIMHQTVVAVRRYYQLLWGDYSTLLVTFLMNAINAVLNGSAYYMAPKTATGSFEKGGALFFAIIYFSLNALTEVTSMVNSREILVKQHKLGLINPIAYVLAQTVADIPVALFHSLVFSSCYYFMLGLVVSAAKFWTFLVIVFTHYLAATSLFRMLGAWSPNLSIAMLLAGAAMPVSLLYSGYGPPHPTVHGWGAWIRWIAPAPYALEALMANEFSEITLHCTESQLVPSGPGYGDLRYQGCTLPGSVKGSAEVSGAIYLAEEYEFYSKNLWQNLGIIIVMWIIYALLTAVGLTITTRESGHSGGRVYKRNAQIPDTEVFSQPAQGQNKIDEEKQSESRIRRSSDSSSSKVSSAASSKSSSGSPAAMGSPPPASTDSSLSESGRGAFTFEDIDYFVGEKQLLNNTSGYVKPGQLTALMGASGAGKTTLLEVISQRKSEGRIEGQMLFNGHALDQSFGRACGFCMQQDVHEPTTTVREALQFSALLRQPARVPREEKNAYVEHIISLLALDAIADAILGSPGDGGLSVEERKRVTIGVELAARPSALLFLDEPTSGLDSQSAYSLVSFLRKIAAEGIPIICTIHQPSAVIFEMFDHVLLLAPGGRTVYFGETGHNSSQVVNYLDRHGATMNKSENPAEFILAATVDRSPGARDWAKTWLESSEQIELKRRISALNDQSMPHAPISQNLELVGKFALPLTSQIMAVTKRHWIGIWRSGFYNFSKLAKAAFNQLFVSFTFYQVGSDVQGFQNYMLSLLILSWLVPASAADIQDVWFERWAIFEAREKNGIYDWKALTTALIVVELPWQVLFHTIAFLCSYWTIGFPNTTTTADYEYVMFLLFSIFGSGFPQLLAALFPNATLSGYANSLFWVLLIMFSGTVVPHSGMVDFYRPWLYWASPLRYFLGGSTANVLHGVEAHCSEKDLTIFDPPQGQTCQQYAASFLESHAGYLVNPDATTDCAHCRFSVGDDYARSLDYDYEYRWRDWAVFLGFCFSTFVLIFVVTGFTRGWKRSAKKG